MRIFPFFRKNGLKNFPFCFSIFLLIAGCQQKTQYGLLLEYKKNFDSIPSASGLAIRADTAYIVCDDGTGIYKVNLRSFHQTKIAINGLSLGQYREPKAIKHDFESACFVKWQGANYLIAFGSGSKESSRDSLLMLNKENHADQKIISLHPFYRQLQQLTHTDSTQWNIEGVTVVGNNMIVANRGNNMLIVFNSNQLFSWLIQPGTSFPEIKYYTITLPSIDKHEARLSGICTVDNNNLLFCASVEDTPDWTKDGPVLGSYLGIYSLKNNNLNEIYLLKDDQGKAMKEKIESVEILQKNSDRNFILLAVGDNDNGTSNLFRIKLQTTGE
jgi:hypothetical protein